MSKRRHADEGKLTRPLRAGLSYFANIFADDLQELRDQRPILREGDLMLRMAR